MTDSSETYNRRYTDLQHEHISDIAQLKIVQVQHTEELRVLSSTMRTLSDQFKQVKWTVFGGVGFYVLQTIGFVDFITRLL